MNESKMTSSYDIMASIDLFSILRDILRNFWVIVMGTIATVMIVNLVVSSQYEKSYTSSATFVVTTRSSSTMVYSQLNAAQTMAENFSNILNSDVLKKQVCKDLGMEVFDAQASAAVIPETNLLTLTVTADTPRKTYEIIRSIMRNYSALTQYVTSDSIMQVLQNPEVPMGGRGTRNIRRTMLKYSFAAFVLLIILFGVLSDLKTTIRNANDLKVKLAARPLGAMYYEQTGIFKKRSQALLVNHVSASFHYVEQMQKLATMLNHAAEKEKAKTILLTGRQKKEGTSVLAVNLAMSLARQGKKVALIDANLRNPSIHRLLNMTNSEGQDLNSYLAYGSALNRVVRYDKDSKLFLVTGTYAADSSELLSRPEMEVLLEKLKAHVDYILIDTPAMSECVDAEILSADVDMGVLVVQYDRDRAEDLNDTIDTLQSSHMIPIYSVLNKIRTMPGERQTVGGYGHYGRYGHYSRYERYGRYGAYGSYGKYGAYGHYEKNPEEDQNQHRRKHSKQLEETLGKKAERGGDA